MSREYKLNYAACATFAGRMPALQKTRKVAKSLARP